MVSEFTDDLEIFLENAAIGSYSVDENSIILNFEGKDEIVIPYTLENGIINLEEGTYFSDQDIDDGIQGHWPPQA